MNLKEAMESVEFSDEDRQRLLALSPFIKEHSEEIIGSVISVVAKDQRVLDILQKNSVTPSNAQVVWQGALEMLFSEPMSEKMVEKMYKVGVVHVDKEVHGDLVIEAMNLFMLKTIGKISEYMKIDKDLFSSVVKLFTVALSAMIASYSEEQDRRRQALLRSLGISDALLNRHMDLGKKYNSQKYF